jgi:hypothetical protein
MASQRIPFVLAVEVPSIGGKLKDERRTNDTLLQDVKVIEESYGTDVLTLNVSCRYVQKLLGNTKVRAYVAERHPDVHQECQSIVAAVLDSSAQSASEN